MIILFSIVFCTEVILKCRQSGVLMSTASRIPDGLFLKIDCALFNHQINLIGKEQDLLVAFTLTWLSYSLHRMAHKMTP